MKLFYAIAIIFQLSVLYCAEGTKNNFTSQKESVEKSRVHPKLYSIWHNDSDMPKDGKCPAAIHYAADNFVDLYVNGVSQGSLSNWNHCGAARTALKVGDVVALRVKDEHLYRSNWYGAIASFYYAGRYHSTGVDDWRAVKASAIGDWTKPTFDACAWPRAQLRPGAGIWNPGKARCFPSQTGARYVWAANAREGDEIYLRYRIGGEASCKQLAKIKYSADDEARVFVNGKEISSHTSWKTFNHTHHRLRVGDVVSIVAKDVGRVWYGAIAIISTGIPGLPVIATGSSLWKAKEVSSLAEALPYTLHSNNSCGWNSAEIRPGAGQYRPGKATPFPYPSAAKYVWAKGVVYGTIVLRHVVGGEVCSCKRAYIPEEPIELPKLGDPVGPPRSTEVQELDVKRNRFHAVK